MAKTPKLKKKGTSSPPLQPNSNVTNNSSISTEPSLHSRAARRQPSPTTTTTTLASKTQSSEDNDQTWLYHTQSSGITKKKKAKKLTHNQRLRQQRSFENAERNVDRHEKKVADSKRQSKKIQSRRVEWEDLNGIVGGGIGGEDGKENAEREQGDEAEVEVEVEGKREKNWTDGMVEVELKEAMESIEGFEWPATAGKDETGTGDEAMEQEKLDAEAPAVVGEDAVSEVDEVL